MNVSAFIELVDQLYYLLIGVAGLMGVISIARGLFLLKYAIQLGGMNSMGTRSFYTEALAYLGSGLMLLYLAQFISGVGEELIGATFSWDQQEPAGTYAVGLLVLKVIRLFGVFTMFKGIMSLTDKQNPGFSRFFLFMLFGLLAVYIEQFGQEFGFHTGINPIGLLSPPR